MSKLSRLIIAAAAMAVACGAHAATPGSGDPFQISFDENGNAWYAVWTGNGYGPQVNDPGYLAPDQSGNWGNVLTYTLPENIGGGGGNILDQNGSISDNLYYYNIGAVGYMEFTSTYPGPDLADVGVVDFGDNIATEAANGTFLFVAGSGDPSATNSYYGVSGAVPEPATWAMMLVGFAGLGFAGYRTSARASRSSRNAPTFSRLHGTPPSLGGVFCSHGPTTCRERLLAMETKPSFARGGKRSSGQNQTFGAINPSSIFAYALACGAANMIGQPDKAIDMRTKCGTSVRAIPRCSTASFKRVWRSRSSDATRRPSTLLTGP